MLEEEMIDVITEELIEFVDSYIMTTTLTHGYLGSIIEDQKSIKFGVDPRCSGGWYNFKHCIDKVARTKFRFVFRFYKDEKIFLEKLINTLDGYVDWKLSVANNSYDEFFFIFNVGSKSRFNEFFNKLISG